MKPCHSEVSSEAVTEAAKRVGAEFPEGYHIIVTVNAPCGCGYTAKNINDEQYVAFMRRRLKEMARKN